MGQLCTGECSPAVERSAPIPEHITTGSDYALLQESCDNSSAEGLPRLLAANDWRGQYDAHFLNGMLKAVWPMVSEFAKTVIRNSVEPGVRAQLGKFSDGFAFVMDDFDLGADPLTFGTLSIGRSVHRTAEDLPEEVNMTVKSRIVWHGNLSLYVSFASVKVGVTRISLEGDLFMEFVSMVPKPPLFQGARACFINPPLVLMDFDAGAMKKIVNFGPVKRTLLDVVENQVSNMLVVPNRMGIRLDPTADLLRITKPRPQGILTLTVVRAEGLHAADINLLSQATSDPFVTVRCGALKVHSSAVKRTTSPVFNFQVFIPIHFPLEQLLKLELMDEDTITAHDFLGKMEVSAKDLIEQGRQGQQEVCHELLDEQGRRGDSGKLFLRSDWRPLLSVPPPFNAGEDVRSLVFVGVYGAHHLPVAREGTTYKVTVQCSKGLPLSGRDPKKPRETGRTLPKEMEGGSEDERMEAALWVKRKELCQRYGMSNEDMAELLGVDVTELVAPTQQSTGSHRATWNTAFEFLLGRADEGELIVVLKAFGPGYEEDGQPRPEAAKEKSTSFVHRVGSALHAGIQHAVQSDVMVIQEWRIPVSEILSADAQPLRRLTVPNKRAALHVHLQVRALAAPCDQLKR